MSNIRQLGVALAGYESTHRKLVPMRGGPLTNANGLWMGVRTSGLVELCPYMERMDLYNKFYFGYESTLPPKRTFAVGGEPWWYGGNYDPWRTQISILRCPSDPGKMSRADWASMGRTNYAFCMGDSQMGIELAYWEVPDKAVRGMFQQQFSFSLIDCGDGASNTIAFGEIGTPSNAQSGDRTAAAMIQGYQATSVPQRVLGRGVLPIDCLATAASGRYLADQTIIARRGTHWGDGLPDYVGFNTILGPNSPSCIYDRNEGAGLHSASSYHFGGIHAVMLDGSTHFISDSVDTGSLTSEAPGVYRNAGSLTYSDNWYSPSAYGVWGAYGSRDGKD